MNSTSEKIELNLPIAFVESIKENLKGNNFESIEEFLTEAARQYAQQTNGKTTPKYRLIGIDLGDLDILKIKAQLANTTTEQTLKTLIENQEAIEETKQIAVNEAIVTALELAFQHVCDITEPSDLQREVAGDLITARAALELSKNGKLDPALIKKWAVELFA